MIRRPPRSTLPDTPFPYTSLFRSAVSRVLASCVMHGDLEENPAKEFDKEMIRERRSPRALPPDDEVAAYVVACPGNLARLVRCLRETGLRLDEAVLLERRQVRGRDRKSVV